METKLSRTLAAFLVEIAKGASPKDAAESAAFNTSLEVTQQKWVEGDPRAIRWIENKTWSVQKEAFDFLHPEVDERIKEASTLLTMAFLNFDALRKGELDKVREYLDAMKEYFK